MRRKYLNESLSNEIDPSGLGNLASKLAGGLLS